MDETLRGFLETPGQNGRAPLRVLAVRGGALGDFILTLPSLRVLRGAGYEVELLTRPAYGRFAREAGIVRQWRSLDSMEAAPLMAKDAEITEGWREWMSGFDAVVSWVPDADGIFREQVLRCGAGAFYQGDWRCAGIGPAAFQLAEAVAFAGRPARAVADLFAADELPPIGGAGWMAFHPGSGSARKNWPLERWIEVMASLGGRNPDLSWLVITGEAEESRLPEIALALERAGLRWEAAPVLELPTLARRLRGCRMLLGHDSGISHLAAACGVPCRLLFGPTDPAVWAPLGDHVRTLRAPDGDLQGLRAAEVLEWLHGGAEE